MLKEADQLHHRGSAQAPRTVSKPKGYAASAPNQVWSWDITYLATTIVGTFLRLYLVMDIYSRKIVGWEIHENETAEHAALLIRKASPAEAISEAGLVLHSDSGSPMKGATMLATLQRLGIVPSFSRPSVSNDNPYSESLFGTMKYTPAFPSKPFESLTAARQWVDTFVHWYNHEHQHSAIRFVTPAARHSGKELAILESGHWGAEAHHYILDWNWDEDRCTLRTGHGPENMTRLRRFATGLIKSRSGDSVAATIAKLARNVRRVFDYLRMTENSRPQQPTPARQVA